MEGDTLYAHRSWTGICIYRIDFKADGNHAVTVNRDPEQYSCTSIDEDRQTLNELLDWWTQSHYDYYNEWLSETVNAIEKSETVFDKLTINGQKVDAVFFISRMNHTVSSATGLRRRLILMVCTSRQLSSTSCTVSACCSVMKRPLRLFLQLMM